MPQTRWPARGWPERLAVALLALSLVGCATPPQPRPREVGVSRVYAGGQEAVTGRLRQALASYRIEPESYDPTMGRLRAERRDLGQSTLAICQPLRVRDPDGERQRETDPLRLDLDLAVEIEEVDSGTQITLQPDFVQTSLNTFTNLEVTQRCRSTGALERDILGALGAEGT